MSFLFLFKNTKPVVTKLFWCADHLKYFGGPRSKKYLFVEQTLGITVLNNCNMVYQGYRLNFGIRSKIIIFWSLLIILKHSVFLRRSLFEATGTVRPPFILCIASFWKFLPISLYLLQTIFEYFLDFMAL